MAQSSAVKQEPSMEEILASIRRIIEDSDPAHETANDDRPTAAAGNSAIDLDIDGIADSFRSELRDPTPVAAPVAEAPKMIVEPVRPQAAAPTFTPPSRSEDAPAAVRSIESPAVSAASKPAEKLAAPATPASEPLTIYASAQPSPAPVAAVEARRDVELASSARHAPRMSIISEQAGRQVTAAFGELQDAFAASRRKSFDEVAEEMMRPMLQDWMDNNLPHMVERLVREEIERIARGGER